MLSKSQLAGPLHASDSLRIYFSDSFPVCRNIRMKRCGICQNESSSRYIPILQQYFYRLKIHALMTESGIPAEIFLSPGSYADADTLYDFSFQLPSGGVIYGEMVCNAYAAKDEAQTVRHSSEPCQKKYESLTGYGISFIRKRIGSALSVIKQRFPDHIHAVTSHGFELKFFYLGLRH